MKATWLDFYKFQALSWKDYTLFSATQTACFIVEYAQQQLFQFFCFPGAEKDAESYLNFCYLCNSLIISSTFS